MIDLPDITDKQNNFVKEYILNGNNATEAYRSVYGNEHTKTATCCVEGSRLLKNPKITPWIEHYKQTIKTHIENEIKYTVDDAFRECDELKIIALESIDKDGRPNVAAANKAVEMKIKIKGLMKEETSVSNSVVVEMGKVEVDGVPLNFDIGDEPNAEDKEINSSAHASGNT